MKAAAGRTFDVTSCTAIESLALAAVNQAVGVEDVLPQAVPGDPRNGRATIDPAGGDEARAEDRQRPVVVAEGGGSGGLADSLPRRVDGKGVTGNPAEGAQVVAHPRSGFGGGAEGVLRVASGEVRVSHDLSRGVDRVAVTVDSAQRPQIAPRDDLAVGGDTHGVVGGIPRGVRRSGDFAKVVDAQGAAIGPAQGAQIAGRGDRPVGGGAERVLRGFFGT